MIDLFKEMHSSHFTFIDLFAGIGGMRRGFEAAGGQCVFTSEWDNYARKTYETNFHVADHPFAGDITQVAATEIPDHDVLVAGFPCQPFSIAGVSKNNALGREHGFRHLTQGTLFFDVARIIEAKRPAAFLLENVRNLATHDRGRTLQTILGTLRDDLGYSVKYRVIDAAARVPQHRERIYIVGFQEGWRADTFEFPELGTRRVPLRAILEPDVLAKYTLTPHLWNYLQRYAEKHRTAGNGFGFGLISKKNLSDPDTVCRTLSARYYKDGSEILIEQNRDEPPRRLTPRECARLMGFPDSFQIPVSDTRAYKQFGNSVVVPIVEAVAHEIDKCLLLNGEAPYMETARGQMRLVMRDESEEFVPACSGGAGTTSNVTHGELSRIPG